MIDWWGVFSNTLWVVGLAVLLAAWSMAYYEAQHDDRKVREAFSQTSYSWALTVGLMLFCAGLAATEDRWWARVLWTLLGVGFLADQLWRGREQPEERP